ncbi:MAG: hypothetical protein GYA24_24995 [Candidatus Lokiarchaeota archaeon]|nr:hypothetical protein [Candidatus Lokiarchaeota archaeon]
MASTIATGAGISSLCTGALILAIIVLFIYRYVKKRARSIFYLALSTCSWLGATWSATAIYLLAGWNLPLAIVCQKLVYAFVFAGIVFTLYFAFEIFYENVKRVFLHVYTTVAIIIISTVFLLDTVDIQAFPDDLAYPLLTIAFEYSIIVVIFIIPVVLGILVVVLKMLTRTTDKVSRAGLKFIAGGQFSILLTFVVDTLATVFSTDAVLYPVFLYATWAFPGIGAFLYYLGWIMPDWLKKRIEA